MERGKTRRTLLIVVAIALAALVIHDSRTEPSQALGARAALSVIGVYRARISPHLRSFVHCRFRPTCSLYGYESVRRYGLLRGGLRTSWRILRCGPWTPMGTNDPP